MPNPVEINLEDIYVDKRTFHYGNNELLFKSLTDMVEGQYISDNYGIPLILKKHPHNAGKYILISDNRLFLCYKILQKETIKAYIITLEEV